MQWWLAVLKNYAGFTGRARRTEFWMFYLFQFIIGTVLLILWFVPKIGVVFIVLSILFWLATIVPTIAVAVRRMHDQNKQGAWVLIGLIPFGIGAIWLLVLLCIEGTRGPNQYGPDPKDPTGANQLAGPAWPSYPPAQQPYPQGQQPYGQAQPQYPQYPQGQGYPQQQAQQPPYPGQ